MTPLQVEVAIVGAGTAGMGAYRAARAHTDAVLLIEGGTYGTTCARVGCMPSKLLIAAAEAAHQARHAPAFGVQVPMVTVDGAAVMARVQRERDRFVGFVLETIDAIAPGARLLTNEKIFDLPALPTSLAVFGPGVLGLELAQAMSRLGVRVKVFGVGGGLAGIHDPAMRDYANQLFNKEFYLDASAQVKSVRETAAGVEVHYLHRDGVWKTERFDHVLAATGRAPAVTSLGLENTGLPLDDRGVPLFDRFTLQCGDSTIFIAGDASNDSPLLHEAADQGRIAGENAARFPDVRPGLRRAPLAVVFTDPQIASVGFNLKQLNAQFKDRFAAGEVSFEDQGRSRVMLRNQGLLKVYGEQGSGLFLGAEMFGPAAEHIGHLLAWAVQQRMTVASMLDMPFYHPVIEEGLRTALRDLSHKLHTGPPMIARCMDCGPGA